MFVVGTWYCCVHVCEVYYWRLINYLDNRIDVPIFLGEAIVYMCVKFYYSSIIGTARVTSNWISDYLTLIVC